MRAARWCAAFAASVLLLGGGAAAAEPPPVTTADDVGVAALPSSFQWSSSGALISPKSDASHNILAVKDPTVVRYNNNWHVFASTANSAGGYNMVYTRFGDWSQAAGAQHYYLDRSAIGTGYRAAPQVFYFAPQNRWYLVYQTGLPSFSTTTDINNATSWSAPRNFQSSMPAVIQQNIGSGPRRDGPRRHRPDR